VGGIIFSQDPVPVASPGLIESLRQKAAERRLSAKSSPDNQIASLLAQADEFEALAHDVEVQERNAALPALRPHRLGFPLKLRR
jgi:hypothetical protein